MTPKQVKYLLIGGGPGGTPAAMAQASAGGSVMLIEKGAGLGGTCLLEGCIPSKILRESARRLHEINVASEFGLCLPSLDVGVNWSAIMQRKRAILKRRSEAALHNTGRTARERMESMNRETTSPGLSVFKDSEIESVMTGVDMAIDGMASALIKGWIYTDVLLGPVLKRLRTTRRISHVFIAELARYHKLLYIEAYL